MHFCQHTLIHKTYRKIEYDEKFKTWDYSEVSVIFWICPQIVWSQIISTNAFPKYETFQSISTKPQFYATFTIGRMLNEMCIKRYSCRYKYMIFANQTELTMFSLLWRSNTPNNSCFAGEPRDRYMHTQFDCISLCWKYPANNILVRVPRILLFSDSFREVCRMRVNQVWWLLCLNPIHT